MEKNPAAKHVVVSGGSRGLGLALARALLAAGHRVSTFARRGSPALAALQTVSAGALFFREADIMASEPLREFVVTATREQGDVFGLVNNSAVAQDGVLATLPEVEITRMLGINMEGTLRLTRHCIRSMLKQRHGGRIINISSIIGSRGYAGLAVYSATKAGLDGMTRSLARELGSRGITVNSVAPGYMQTEMSAGLGSEQMQQIVRRTPLGRLATLADITPLVLFLLGPDAALITGQTIVVDGGLST
jgi:3-oxoacyl-[acyl-carrier protein] reductase